MLNEGAAVGGVDIAKKKKAREDERDFRPRSAFRDISHKKGKKKLKLAPRINRDETRRTCSRESSLCNF